MNTKGAMWTLLVVALAALALMIFVSFDSQPTGAVTPTLLKKFPGLPEPTPPPNIHINKDILGKQNYETSQYAAQLADAINKQNADWGKYAETLDAISKAVIDKHDTIIKLECLNLKQSLIILTIESSKLTPEELAKLKLLGSVGIPNECRAYV